MRSVLISFPPCDYFSIPAGYHRRVQLLVRHLWNKKFSHKHLLADYLPGLARLRRACEFALQPLFLFSAQNAPLRRAPQGRYRSLVLIS